jgi:glycosyltransferase involved in cell wall biosynthesis
MLLTIYILARNSPENVERMLNSLLPWESQETEIIVGDNSDDHKVVELAECRAADFKGALRCIKHVCNLGYAGNMLRGFEVARGQYVWIVGSNDQFLPAAVATVEAVVRQRQDAMLLFPVNGLKARAWPLEKVYNDFIDVVRELELGPINSINSTVYKVEVARRYLPLAYESVSLIPQTTMIAAMLKDGHHLYFCPRQVLERLPRKRNWDPRRYWSTLSMIYPAPEDRMRWNRVRGVILKDWSRWILNIEQEGYPITWPLIVSTGAQFGAESIPLMAKMIVRIVRRKMRSKRAKQAT